MARIVSCSFGRAWIRFVAYTTQPLIGYGLPVSVASRMPVVIASVANGYFRPGLSTLPLSDLGYAG